MSRITLSCVHLSIPLSLPQQETQAPCVTLGRQCAGRGVSFQQDLVKANAGLLETVRHIPFLLFKEEILSRASVTLDATPCPLYNSRGAPRSALPLPIARRDSWPCGPSWSETLVSSPPESHQRTNACQPWQGPQAVTPLPPGAPFKGAAASLSLKHSSQQTPPQVPARSCARGHLVPPLGQEKRDFFFFPGGMFESKWPFSGS